MGTIRECQKDTQFVIHRLEIENFYSIRDQQVIDLVAAKSATAESGRLVPIGPGASEFAPLVVALFGPNASGKSTALRGLFFLSWFMRDSFIHGIEKALPLNRFADEESLGAPTRLAIRLNGPRDPIRGEKDDHESCTYEYEVILGGASGSPQKVIAESLKYWPLETHRPVNLFKRDRNGQVKAHKAFGLTGYKSALEKILRDNVSVISTLDQLRHPIASELCCSATNVASNIYFTQRNDLSDNAIAQLYEQDPTLLAALNNEIERIDFGISAVQIETSDTGLTTWVHHNGLTSPIPFSLESHGTRQFIKFFPLLFQALTSGGLAIIDELDISIHPHILPHILSWFSDPKRNPHNAQLWMTAQNPSILEELIKEEVYFCQKDSSGCTEIYGLKDIQSVRRDDNFYRKYLSGVYGAVPTFG